MRGTISLRQATPFTVALSANSTDASYASKVPTTTKPSNNGVYDLSQVQEVVQGVQAVFFGAGTAGQTINARLIGWKSVGDGTGTLIWIPTVLADITATLSTVTGVSGSIPADTDKLADTLSLATGFSASNVIVTSPTGNIVAHATINLDGYSLIEWSVHKATATNGNVLWAPY